MPNDNLKSYLSPFYSVCLGIYSSIRKTNHAGRFASGLVQNAIGGWFYLHLHWNQ